MAHEPKKYQKIVEIRKLPITCGTIHHVQLTHTLHKKCNFGSKLGGLFLPQFACTLTCLPLKYFTTMFGSHPKVSNWFLDSLMYIPHQNLIPDRFLFAISCKIVSTEIDLNDKCKNTLSNSHIQRSRPLPTFTWR